MGKKKQRKQGGAVGAGDAGWGMGAGLGGGGAGGGRNYRRRARLKKETHLFEKTTCDQLGAAT